MPSLTPNKSGGGQRLYTKREIDVILRIAREFAQYIIGPVHVTNYPVQHSLQKFDWRSSGARHSFHRWLRP